MAHHDSLLPSAFGGLGPSHRADRALLGCAVSAARARRARGPDGRQLPDRGMACHGVPWCAMDVSWRVMAVNYLTNAWRIMTCHGASWRVMAVNYLTEALL